MSDTRLLYEQLYDANVPLINMNDQTDKQLHNNNEKLDVVHMNDTKDAKIVHTSQSNENNMDISPISPSAIAETNEHSYIDIDTSNAISPHRHRYHATPATITML